MWEFTFSRSFFIVVISYAYLVKNGIKVNKYRPDDKYIFLSRCFFGSAGFVVTSISLKLIPLSQFTLVMSTSPFSTAVLQYMWIK